MNRIESSCNAQECLYALCLHTTAGKCKILTYICVSLVGGSSSSSGEEPSNDAGVIVTTCKCQRSLILHDNQQHDVSTHKLHRLLSQLLHTGMLTGVLTNWMLNDAGELEYMPCGAIERSKVLTLQSPKAAG